MQRLVSSGCPLPRTTTPALHQYLYLLPFLPPSLAQSKGYTPHQTELHPTDYPSSLLATYSGSDASSIDSHLSMTSGLLTLLQSPPGTLWSFLASLILLSLLTYAVQRSAGQIGYALGWVYRRLQGDSAYEEGKKIPGFDNDESSAEQLEGDGGLDNDEYAADSDLGRALDYIVAVDDSPAARFQAGALRARSIQAREEGENDHRRWGYKTGAETETGEQQKRKQRW